ncbi:Predicted nuclease of the RNAse H fold, HicB family [Salegentibacter holothuriorum]|uniref:Predicted nuclease of the RNAse H fold, HicB family n=1 Tax=Salegentibacter holothuriorum TaxID=241145 RepID=A0A1T5C6C8_9FLAO|nr:type II toxin-antitoxin system HicB family antitoxin [Salegentibacter holothuriorum]SKB54899.1 Predicted nuclease of the RNAse H fold, HicB family [Salegentibacter holothuriorum]
MKNYLEHKGYIGTVEFSADDKVFFGKIQGINDLILFEGESVSELENSFIEAVSDYLETCKEIGKEPNKTFKGSFNVRVNKSVHQKLFMLAAKKGINLNQLVNKSLNFTVDNEEIVLK